MPTGLTGLKIEGTGATAAVHTLHSDHLGSLRAIVDAAGAPLVASRYAAYGRQAQTPRRPIQTGALVLPYEVIR